jgi:hypothetical protein
MVRIGAAIAVAEETAVGEAVVVGALAVLDRRGGRDGEGDFGDDSGLEDALRADQGDPGALEVEAALEDGAGDRGFAEALALLGEEGEGAKANRASRSSLIAVLRPHRRECTGRRQSRRDRFPGCGVPRAHCIQQWTLTLRRSCR